MLIRYKKDFEKIAMGLLSFMPEEKRDVKKLQQTMKAYEENSNWQLFLWRDEDILGAVGIRLEDDMHVIIQHISVNPSHRNTGIGKKMIEAIKTQFGEKYTIQADNFTEGFYKQCLMPE
ncbi:MAG TPA: GNAT family N-acetyltransferase [Candidatus Dormibacteraeota bacterium]|nr:GNAT family N-acetyltransferase [Candidatus Dormibacteraeota bacterium]